MATTVVTAGGVQIANDLPLTVIAGPCQLEGLDHALEIAREMARICADCGVGYVFKASFDKANRTSLTSPRGPGLTEGLRILAEVKSALNIPVLTDVHEAAQCARVAEVADILQIPAFLCRQTDLLVAAAQTGRVVNVKKAQFLAPWDMQHVTAKLAGAGNDKILLTERGTSFGYNTLVTDMRSLPTMARLGYPVIMDATHAVQAPGGQGASSGGQRVFAPVLARAAVSLGIAGVFIETHPDPDNAPSDGPNMIALSDMPGVVSDLAAFDQLAKSRPLPGV
ncbi:2-dehydro-3-deoxyphosphooctonate aldolase [Aliiroseovarius sp. xm-m-379]|uniref:3-deoxy-8-phosphooctulonate synthase n=1 Tax=unclassified Aliiroseovarius TaxID=2623558 RepID=UPI001568D491|nr:MULTISPECIES: 3-deoxy-8-phosphooctulonate synthase [unclassified Aliiroseovarius]NRP11310.1 2-dehydro-3-deoxyphosphooctonate aldolase [Aliiroseovarius sp. xm-d-517]NRP23808.1 2-dehydro-3-deoxyphosphooctonate aldolase [Aliiroseovarius sp. xm-m-379]NRP28946.1 2-dehydro-3-deoxyphosphooctonate aldolase [Aliiroseovarius sp. xm-m-314]NRP32607.1 2-dehydro-3-deoxyphosphooctonate aldolase [Aliiroseovarius sp. xm-a-104]NRP41140.1 2-dehydro-3-deoxyphosphooctonate aldolase [Aliiroseovarius sp. xm-m-339